MTMLASATRGSGRQEEGLALFEEALEFRRKVLGPDPDTRGSLTVLCFIYGQRGEFEKAMKLGEEAMSLQKNREPGILKRVRLTSDVKHMAEDAGKA